MSKSGKRKKISGRNGFSRNGNTSADKQNSATPQQTSLANISENLLLDVLINPVSGIVNFLHEGITSIYRSPTKPRRNNMSKKKKGKGTVLQNKPVRNDAVNYSAEESAAVNDNTPAVEQNFAPPQQTFAENSSDSLLLPTLNTLSKQVTEIVNALPEKIASRKDLSELIDAINNTIGKVKNFSQNLSADLDAKTRDVESRLQKITGATQSVDKKIDGVLGKKDFDITAKSLGERIRQTYDSVNVARSGVQKDLEGVKQTISEKMSVAQKNSKDSFNSLTQQLLDVEKRIKYIGESTELIQSLPGKIDDITELLTSRGLQIKQELPALNHDEETLAQLAQFGEKILQQLSIAARWYARVLPELSKHETEIKNLNVTHEQEKLRAEKDGETRGRKAVVRELLARYGDNVHALMSPAEDADGRLKVLATFLENEGIQPIYQIHAELEITDDNLMNYEHNIANLRTGKIVITSPGYVFDT